jgi:DNA repair protein RadC
MREVFSVAFAFPGTASILMSHSHPSQDPSPSDPDIVLTRRALEAGDILGIPLLDHLILGSSGAPDSAWASAMPLVRPRAKYAT